MGIRNLPPTTDLLRFWIEITVVFCFLFVGAEFSGVPVSGFYSFISTGLQFATVCFFTAGLLLLLVSFRRVFAILFPLLLLICSDMTYLRLTIGATLNPLSIEAAMISDAGMWESMVSLPMIIIAILAMASGVFLGYYRMKHVGCSRKESLILFAIGALITVTPGLISRLHGPVGERLPYSIFFAFKGYLENHHQISEDRDNFAKVPASPLPDSPEVIFILGEALRADHLPTNGYSRNVTPNLSSYRNLVSFSKVYSPYTFTEASVPFILTEAGAENPEAGYDRQSFITLFKKAGYRTSWLANQNLSGSYTYFAHEADSLVFVNAGKTLYSYEKWLDSDILPHLESILENSSGKQQFILIHTIGQHWWYRSHYTDRQAHFKPEVDHKDVGGLSREQMVNSYDNTIIATDSFIDSVYRMIADRNAIIIYISDHGEMLGENGLYLHATEGKEAHYPACFVIWTQAYQKNHPEMIERMIKNKDKEFTTESIFHTVLHLAGINTPALDPSKTLTIE